MASNVQPEIVEIRVIKPGRGSELQFPACVTYEHTSNLAEKRVVSLTIESGK